jgi:hypothetical protein
MDADFEGHDLQVADLQTLALFFSSKRAANQHEGNDLN